MTREKKVDERKKREMEKIDHYRNFFGGVNRIMDEEKRKALRSKGVETLEREAEALNAQEEIKEDKLSRVSSEKNSRKRDDSFDGENFLSGLTGDLSNQSDYFKSPIKKTEFEKNNFYNASTTENTPEEGKTFKSRIMVNLPNKLFNNKELQDYKSEKNQLKLSLEFEQEKLSRYGF